MSSQQRRTGLSQRIENSQKSKRIRAENSQSSQLNRGESSQLNRGESSQLSRGESSQLSRGESSQRTRGEDLSEEQLEAAVQNVTAFLLCEMRSKRKIRKEDVVCNALNKTARQYAVILKRVQANLSNIFGIQLVNIQDSNDTFIIVNKHRREFIDLTLELSTESEIQDDVILTVVLGSIFMNRGQMYEYHLMTILETIGFLSDEFYDFRCEHKMKDHVTNLVKKIFVKQMYLTAEVVPRPQRPQNPPLPESEFKVTLYRWGFRAMVEVNIDKLVKYLEKMHDDNRPPGFPLCYFQELKTEQQNLIEHINRQS